jgi:3-hydroxyisobutyrate dehydrogenase
MRLGFVGAGRMGRPMVRRLVAAGHPVQVLARSDDARRALADDGASVVPALSEVADGVDAVVVCVLTDDQVRQACLEQGLIASMRPGAVLIVHTTGSPRTATALAQVAARRRVLVVDAPVSGGPPDVAAGTLTVFAGAGEQGLASAGPVLAAYADPVLHVGPVGSGQSLKLVNNALFAATIGLVAQAARVGAELGLDEPTLLPALLHGSSASRALGLIANRGSVAAFARSVAPFVGKDVEVARAVAADAGCELGLLDEAVQSMFPAVQA